MRATITLEKLKETSTYKELLSKKETVKLAFLEQKSTREKITNAFLVFKNTNHIPNTVSGVNLSVVKDLIRELGTDRSHLMTAEDIKEMNQYIKMDSNE